MPDRTLLFIAEPQSVSLVFPALKESGFQAGLADNLAGAVNFIKKSKPCLVFSRPVMQGYSVEKLLAQAEELDDFPPIIVFSRSGSADEARRLLELGARDYWIDPLNWEKIELIIPEEKERGPAFPVPPAQAAAPAAPSQAASSGTQGRFHIIGAHPAVLRVLALARQVARSKATVLISGESGTGKEMFARFLHFHSDRTDRPFIAINCAALPEHLLESELFGHEKGAFTGAITRKLGKFELASGGTLLLDEISEMDMGLQAKLLRVLQEGEIDRVGGVETIKVDVRVLATTNRDMEQAVRDGKFRQDLFYRLNVIPLRLPALRDRGDDVLGLAEFFVGRFCDEYRLPRLAFSSEARGWLMDYDWPGNVRELQNLMERAVLLAGSGPIERRHFLADVEDWAPEGGPPGEATLPGPAAAPAAAPTAFVDQALKVMPISEMERQLIIKSLQETGGNRTQAADLLGISVRTLRNKLNEYRQQGLEL